MKHQRTFVHSSAALKSTFGLLTGSRSATTTPSSMHKRALEDAKNALSGFGVVTTAQKRPTPDPSRRVRTTPIADSEEYGATLEESLKLQRPVASEGRNQLHPTTEREWSSVQHVEGKRMRRGEYKKEFGLNMSERLNPSEVSRTPCLFDLHHSDHVTHENNCIYHALAKAAGESVPGDWAVSVDFESFLAANLDTHRRLILYYFALRGKTVTRAELMETEGKALKQLAVDGQADQAEDVVRAKVLTDIRLRLVEVPPSVADISLEGAWFEELRGQFGIQLTAEDKAEALGENEKLFPSPDHPPNSREQLESGGDEREDVPVVGGGSQTREVRVGRALSFYVSKAGQLRMRTDDCLVFTLRRENIAFIKALYELASRFGVRNDAFVPASRTTQGKDNITTQTVFVRGLPDLMLWSVNDMQFQGFRLHISKVERCSLSQWVNHIISRQENEEKSSGLNILTTIVLRGISSTSDRLEDQLNSIKSTGYINYIDSDEQKVKAAIALLQGNKGKAITLATTYPGMRETLKNFLRNPTLETAALAKENTACLKTQSVLRAFARTGGRTKYMLNHVPDRHQWIPSLLQSEWNVMASKRVRDFDSLSPMVGDLVVKPENLSQCGFLTASQVQRLETEAELNSYLDEVMGLLREESGEGNGVGGETPPYLLNLVVLPLPGFEQSADVFPLLPGLTQEDFRKRILSDVPNFFSLTSQALYVNFGVVYKHRSGKIFRRVVQRPSRMAWKCVRESTQLFHVTTAPPALMNTEYRFQREETQHRQKALGVTEPTTCADLQLSEWDDGVLRQLRRSENEDDDAGPGSTGFGSVNMVTRQYNEDTTPVAPDAEAIAMDLTVAITLQIPDGTSPSVALREHFSLMSVECQRDHQLQSAVHKQHLRLGKPGFVGCRFCKSPSHNTWEQCALIRYRYDRTREETARANSPGNPSKPALPNPVRWRQDDWTLHLEREDANSPWGLELTERCVLRCLLPGSIAHLYCKQHAPQLLKMIGEHTRFDVDTELIVSEVMNEKIHDVEGFSKLVQASKGTLVLRVIRQLTDARQ